MTPTLSAVSPSPVSPSVPSAGPVEDDGPTHLFVRPWIDPVVDEVGHDPRSAYVERFWLSSLGPSTTWLVRHLAAGLEAAPDGFCLDLAVAARALGLGRRRGRNSPFARALERSRQFGLTRDLGSGQLAARRHLPPLSRNQVARLPHELQQAHAEWNDRALAHPVADEQRRRARALALSLFELGEDATAVERELHRWQFHPALAADAARWAWDRHRVAEAAARRLDPVGARAATTGGDVA